MSPSSVRALVTGGAGFIGGHIVDALLASGHEVTVLDNLDPRVHPAGPAPVPEAATFVQGDILNDHDLDDALQSAPEVIFHEAAMVGLGRGALDAKDFMRVNVQGTIDLLQAVGRRPKPPRVVLASTMALYGEGAYSCPTCNVSRSAQRHAVDLDAGRWEPRCKECDTDLVPFAVSESQPAVPDTMYAISKLAQEQVALNMARELHLEVVALRYHNVYGARMPRDTPYAGVAALFRSRVLAGHAPLVHEDGGQLRDFVHVEDIARANLLAATAPADQVTGQAFNVGTGNPRPIMDLAAALAEAAGTGEEPELSGTYRPGDVRHVFASIEKARRVLGYEPRVSFEDGVRRFLTDSARAAPQGVTQ